MVEFGNQLVFEKRRGRGMELSSPRKKRTKSKFKLDKKKKTSRKETGRLKRPRKEEGWRPSGLVGRCFC